MDNDRNRGIGGPSIETCLLYAGHTGVSIDQRKTIYGFNPDPPMNRRIFDVMDDRAAGLAFRGIVRDDFSIFEGGAKHGLNVLSFEVLSPEANFAVFEQSLQDEIKGTRHA